MSDEQAARAIQQLYEDTDSRDELSDDEANVLLQWGEGQLKALGAKGLDDAAFDEQFAHLRGVLKSINRYTGLRAYKTPEELTAMLNELAANAQALGAEVQAAQLDVPQAQGAADNIALIQTLTSLVTPGQSAVAQTASPAGSSTGTQAKGNAAAEAPKSDSEDEQKPRFKFW
jgi:hypothetical protein